jgi:tetratricopeptide (TPR) repeat protein
MKLKKVWPLAIVVAAAGLAIAAQELRSNHLIVHEWGTFLAMSGSDGVALEGMYHEEHALPAFVHARSRDQFRLPSVVLKGETPVIYFYTSKAQKVRVDARFPRGVWTQWFPQAQVVGPQLAQTDDAAAPRNGRIRWCAEIIPAGNGSRTSEPPPTSGGALWNFARDVDAAYVRTPDRTVEPARSESERFLFYRGLGEAPLPIRFSASKGGTLESGSDDRFGIKHIFIIRVEDGKGVYACRQALKPGERASGLIPSMADAKPLPEFQRQLADHLAGMLVASGLYPKEAQAMVNTWSASYFQTSGTRALFVLPQAWTDAFIPLAIKPLPAQTVRVMVGRIELLTPDRERLAEQAVADLGASEVEARERAFAYLRDQGRYVEPIVRRVLRTSHDERVKLLCKRLLATDFVTELRAAIHNAADGTRLLDDPAHVRAQLAVLLKQLGLKDEAKAEGERALALLKAKSAPRMDTAESRGYLRAYARAMEATGDDREAAHWYSQFVRFASQVATNKDCRFCHRDAGPSNMAWFRDWWAGSKYAELATHLGSTDQAIAENEAAVAKDPNDVSARMLLGYLYRSKGQTQRADTLWAKLGELYRGEPSPIRDAD